MPRAFDRRIPDNDHDPLRNLLDFADIDSTAVNAAEIFRAGLINLIKLLTGIDLTSWTTLFNGIFDETGVDLPNLLTNVASLGDLVEALTGSPGGYPELTSWANDIPELSGIVNALTGSPGELTDLAEWSGLIPLLSGEVLSSSVIPNLDASKITSGMFGSGLIPNLDASKVTSGTFNVSRIPNLAASIINSGTFDLARIPALPTSQITSGTFPQSMITNLSTDLRDIVDKAVQGAGNLADTGFSTTDLKDVLGNLQLGLTQANEAIAELQTAAGGTVTSGRSVSINFGNYPNGAVPAIFTKVEDTGAGSITVSSGRLEWQDSGNSPARETYIYTVEPLLTDYFDVAYVMPRQSENPDPSYNYLIGRSNSAGTIYTMAQIGRTTLRIGANNNGVWAWFGSPISHTPPAGALIRFRGGTTSGVRIFQVLVNGVVRATYTDSGSVSQVGSSFRYCGLGMEAANRFTGQSTPGSVSSWSMNDNTPVAVTGTTLRVYRASTSPISKTSGEQFLPSGLFDTVDYRTSDITWNNTTNEATFTKPGTYMFAMRLESTTTQGFSEEWYTYYTIAGVQKGRSADKRGISAAALGVPHFPQDRVIGGEPFIYYITTGQTIRLGMNSTATQTIIGDSAGLKTWFTATKIG